MTSFSITRDKLNSFLSSFGKDLMDIAITVNRDSVHAAVAKSTHYISRQVECSDAVPGNLYISDIPKVKAFLATSKIPDLSFTQEGKTGTLHIRCGNTSLQIPTTSYIESQKKVGLMSKTISDAQDSMWRLVQHSVDPPRTSFSRLAETRHRFQESVGRQVCMQD